MSEKKKQVLIVGLIIVIMLVAGLLIYSTFSSLGSRQQLVESSTEQIESVALEEEMATSITEESTINRDHLFAGLLQKESVEPLVNQEGELTFRSVGDVLIHDRVSYLADTDSPIYQETVNTMLEAGFNEELFNPSDDYDFMPMLAYIQPLI